MLGVGKMSHLLEMALNHANNVNNLQKVRMFGSSLHYVRICINNKKKAKETFENNINLKTKATSCSQRNQGYCTMG